MEFLLLALVCYFGLRWLVYARVLEQPALRCSLLQRVLRWLAQAGGGVALAVVLVALALALPLLLGRYTLAPGRPDILTPAAAELLGVNEVLTAPRFLLLMALNALWEELAFRGILLLLLVLALGALAKAVAGQRLLRSPRFQALLWLHAIIVSAAAFSLLHGDNPHSAPLASVNIFLIGVMLGFALFFTRGLTLPVAFHCGWNSLLELVNLPVSGYGFPTAWHPFTLAAANGGMLTGGAFGPEASSGLTVLLLITLAVCLSTLPRFLRHAPAPPPPPLRR